MKYILFYFVFFSLLPARDAVHNHDFHLSLCEMNYETERNTLEINLHVFADDIERAIRRTGSDKLHLATGMEVDSADRKLVEYLREHFKISSDDGPLLKWNFLGKEATDDFRGMWCYFEIQDVPAVKSMTVQNDILIELFDDQKNILHYSKNGEMQGTLYFKSGTTKQMMPLR